MKVLLVVEKISIKKLYEKIIENLDIDFKIDVDIINPVFEIDDGVILFREFNGKIYCNNKLIDMNYINLDELGIPPKKFLWKENNTLLKQKQLDYKNDDYDLIVGACDPDWRGNIGFYKYTKERNLKNTKWLEVNDLTNNYLKNKLLNLEDSLEDFDTHLKGVLEEMEKNDFKSHWQRGDNGFDLFMETADKFETLVNFANYFGIPYRTVQNWQSRVNKCPKYLYDLIEYKLLNEGILCGDKMPKFDK